MTFDAKKEAEKLVRPYSLNQIEVVGVRLVTLHPGEPRARDENLEKIRQALATALYGAFLEGLED